MPLARRFAFPVLAVVLGLAAAAAVGEGLLRALWPQRSAVTVGMFCEDPDAGYALQPGYRNVVRVPEYTTDIWIDDEGYRIPAADPPASSSPAGRAAARILALGDSFTFGVGVDAEAAWPAVLERSIAGAPEPVRVRNGGVGGYGPLRSERLLVARQAAWEPQVLIHALYVGNDLEDSRPESFLEVPQIRDGRMVSQVRSPLTRTRFWLRVHSHLYAFLREQLYELYQRTPLSETGKYLDPIGLAEWPDSLTQGTLPAALTSVRRIAAWARERDARYLVVLVPAKYQVLDEAWATYRKRWRLPDRAFDRDHAQRVVADALRAEGIEHLDLLPALRSAPDPEAYYFPVDPHWTAAGHRAAAEEIHRAVLERGWLQPSRTGRAPVASAPTG